MNHFTPRHRKFVPPSKGTKLVRIDFRTQVEVSMSIPDDLARERYYARHKIEPVPENLALYPVLVAECFKEIPSGSLEEMEIMADDTPDPRILEVD